MVFVLVLFHLILYSLAPLVLLKVARFYSFFPNVYLFLRERDRDREGRTERGRQRI